jgi:AbrB family looped-hinge helix DNA binding protein
MTIVKISSKYKIVIPKEIRKAMGLTAGEKACIFQYDDRIEFIPLKSPEKMRGFLKGIDAAVERDQDRP